MKNVCRNPSRGNCFRYAGKTSPSPYPSRSNYLLIPVCEYVCARARVHVSVCKVYAARVTFHVYRSSVDIYIAVVAVFVDDYLSTKFSNLSVTYDTVNAASPHAICQSAEMCSYRPRVEAKFLTVSPFLHVTRYV